MDAEHKVEKLESLLSALYQVLGALDAPEHVLTRVLAASEGEPFSLMLSLLPFTSER